MTTAIRVGLDGNVSEVTAARRRSRLEHVSHLTCDSVRRCPCAALQGPAQVLVERSFCDQDLRRASRV